MDATRKLTLRDFDKASAFVAKFWGQDGTLAGLTADMGTAAAAFEKATLELKRAKNTLTVAAVAAKVREIDSAPKA